MRELFEFAIHNNFFQEVHRTTRMVMRPIVLLSLLSFFAPALVAQYLDSSSPRERIESSSDEASLSRLIHATAPELTLHAEDSFSVEVYGIKDFAPQQRISEDGSVMLPFIGNVHVAGLTVQETQSRIATELRLKGIVKDPQVTLSNVVQPWAIVTVSGDVLKPGVFPAVGHLSLSDFLSEAGGMNQNTTGYPAVNAPASTKVTLFRPSLGRTFAIPLGTDASQSPFARIPLFAGDEIRVSRMGLVYAVGAFKTQGAFALKSTSPTTVMELVALAGGIGYEADVKDAHIIRSVEGNRKIVLEFDVAKILRGRAADVNLQANDILFVPTTAWKAAIKGGGAGILVSIASAYLYAHP